MYSYGSELTSKMSNIRQFISLKSYSPSRCTLRYISTLIVMLALTNLVQCTGGLLANERTYRQNGLAYLRGFDGSSTWSWWLAIIWLGYKKFLDGGGKHFLQKEWRHGRSLGSLLWKFNLQMGQQSIKLWVLWAFSLSSWTGMLSASFSTIITISSGSNFSALSSMTVTNDWV